MEFDRYRPIINIGVCPEHTWEEIRENVAWYKKCGYGGFAINGGSRKVVERIEDWIPGYLEACQRFVQVAKEMEMNVWIFDEWGYPSGTAGGQVLTEERFHAKKYRICYDLIVEAGQSISLPVPDKFVSACVFPVDYFSFYKPKDKGSRVLPENGMLHYTAKVKSRLVAVGWEYLTFITHVMKKHTPDDPTVGTVDLLSREAVARFIKYMHEWYVEPLGDEFGKTVQGFFYDEPEICYDFPYTEALSETFYAEHGYQLEDVLPEVMAWKGKSALIGIEDSFPRMQKAFADYNKTWNGMLARNFYGQIEEWCHAHNLLSVGHQDLDNQLETLRTVSGDFFKNSYHNDRPGIDVIWDNIAPDKFDDFARYAGCAKRTYKKAGAMSETFAEMGPSMYPDRIRFTMEQQIVRGVDQFFLYINNDPKDLNVKCFAKEVNDRVTRTAELCNQGKAGAEVAIYVPMDDISYFAMHKDPHQKNKNPQIWERVNAVAEALCYAPIDYDYAWQGTLDTLTERGIKTLLLPGQTDLTAEEEKAAREFAALGGTIISIGRNCVPLMDVAVYYANAFQWLKKQPGELKLRGLGGVTPRISLTTRVCEDKILYFLLNETTVPNKVQAEAVSGCWMELDQVSGEWVPADMTQVLEFHGMELKIFCRFVSEDGMPTGQARKRGTAKVLSGWKFTGPDGETKQMEELLPWPEIGLGDYYGFAAYETNFDWQGGLCELDLGDVRFAAIVTLDGEKISLPMAPYRVRRELAAGTHTLRIEVLNSSANSLYSGENEGRNNFRGGDWIVNGGYWMLYQFERIYCECGLLGPVKVTELKK